MKSRVKLSNFLKLMTIVLLALPVLLVWLIVISITIWMIPNGSSNDPIFYDIPLGAINGEWSY